MRFVALLLLWVCFVPFAVVHGADGYDGAEYPHSTLVTATGDYFVVIEQPSTGCGTSAHSRWVAVWKRLWRSRRAL